MPLEHTNNAPKTQLSLIKSSVENKFYLQTHHFMSEGTESSIATLWRASVLLELGRVPTTRGPTVGNELKDHMETVGLMGRIQNFIKNKQFENIHERTCEAEQHMVQERGFNSLF